jgi:hypothetical protein
MSLKSLKNQTLRNKSTINSVNLTGGASTGPVITSIVVTDSNYNNLDDTALLPAGGYAKLIGSGFASGCSAYFNGTSVTTTFVSATEVRVVIPATSVGTYNVMLFNPSTAGAIYLNLGISSAPTFTTTAGSLGTSYETTAVSTSIAATGDDPITYALYSGSLPTGVTLASNGTLSGTSPVEASSTTYSFIVQATDAQLQDTTRSFSLTISTDVVTWSTPAADFAYTLVGNEAMANVNLLATSAAGYGVTYAANTLPTGVSLSGNTVFGTPTTEQTIYTALTATANTTGRTATRYVSWSVVLGDAFWKYNTLLIPGASTTFVDDASTNNFGVSIFGDTKPNSFNPYTPGYYSNFFDGSGDWLTFSNNAGYEFGSGAFTVELWAYITGSSGTVANYSNGQSSNSNFAWELYQVSTTVMQFSVFEGATQYISSSSAFKTNSWNHIACVRSGNTLTTYVNGVAGGTTANITGVSISAPAGATLKLCSYGNGSSYLTGYISNFRVVKGTAVYTTTFTPSTTPLTAITNTSLLTCQSNRFIDNSTNALTVTVTGNTLISSFDPFVPNSSYSSYGSGYFDGTGDYLSVPANSVFEMGSGDFTYEWWMNPSSAPAQAGIWIQSPNSGTFGPLWITYQSGTLNLYATTSNGSWNIGNSLTISGTIPLNTWTHVAVTRSGGVWRSFINGVQFWTITNAGSLYASNSISTIGGYTDSLYFTGYISNFRTVKGTAVYTSNFTPSTTPLTAIANTSLLTLQNNQSVNNNVFLDNSTNNFLVTRAGNTTQGTFSPYGGNWSNYFDGTGDYLGAPAGTAIMGTSDFTIELWVYHTAGNAWAGYYYQGEGGPGGGINFRKNDSNQLSLSHDAVVDVFTSTATVPINQWVHIACSRSSGTIRFFINGTVVGTVSYATSFTGSAGGQTIGSITSGSYLLAGYISNFRVVKGTGVYTAAFTPPTTPLTAITGTEILTCQSNRLVDNSIKNTTITKAGDVSVQRFSPFNPSSVTPTSYSGYFGAANGNDLYLSSQASGSGGVTLSGNYTIEMWLYPTAASGSGYSMLVATNTNGGFFQFYYNSAGNIGYYTPAFGQPTTSSAPLTFNAWQHIALVRSSNSVKVYVNGVEKAFSSTITDSSTIYANYIGGLGTVYNTFGYISNLRITNTAVYTTTFTPSTSPLTAISGTQLLTLQSDKFIDNSTNNYTINVDGSPRPTQQNPFGVTSTLTNGYTPSTIGGSGYFDGTGDYLTVPSSTAFYLATGDFTIEAWIYKRTSGKQIIVSQTQNTGSPYAGWSVYVDNSSLLVFEGTNGALIGSPTVTVPLNTWTHVAIVKSSSTVTLYQNGVSVNSGGAPSISNFNTVLSIGNYSSYVSGADWNGYISDLRIVKGTAIYSSNFVPPTAPILSVQNTSILTNMTSAGIYDATMMNNMETVADAKISTAISKFGGSSMSFDGTGDYLTSNVATTDLYAFGSGDFTIEMWLYLNSVSGTQVFYDQRPLAGGVYPTLYMSGSTLYYYTNAANRITGSTLSTSQWYHIAVSRSGTSTKLFVNGTQSGSTYTDTNVYLNAALRPFIGGDGTNLGTNGLNGYIDDLRVTKGYARYTANFTAPTSAFQIK